MISCKSCDDRFQNVEDHVRHFELFHKVNSKSLFMCGWQNCSGKLTNLKNYKLHVQNFHDQGDGINICPSDAQQPVTNAYKCTSCEFSCERQGTLRQHRFWKHSKNADISDHRGNCDESQVEPSAIDFEENVDFNSCLASSSSDCANNFNCTIPLSSDGIEELIEKKFVHLCLSLTSKFHIPDSTLQHMINCYDLLFKEGLQHAGSVLAEELAALDLNKESANNIVNKVIGDFKLAQLHSSTGPMRSYYMRKEQYKKFPYVAPQQRSLGLDEFHKPALYHFVKLEESLKMLLDDDSVYEQYLARRQRPSVISEDLCDIMDGSFLKTHPLFSVDSNALQLILYHDGIQVCNGLGPDATSYNITHMSYTLGNLYPWNRAKVDPIQLLLLCKEKHIDYFGYECVLKPIITSLKNLESAGILIRGEVLKCGVAVLLGDNKGTHCICGLTEGFSRGEYFCRYCEEPRKVWVKRMQGNEAEVNNGDSSSESESSEDDEDADAIRNGDVEVCGDSDNDRGMDTDSSDDETPLINLVPLRTLQVLQQIPDNKAPRRTEESYQECLRSLSHHPGGVKGVVGFCELNKLESFHLVRATPPCLGHDLLEGIIPVDLMLCLKQLSKEFKFTFEMLNRRIKSFIFHGAESLDKPPAKLDAKKKKVKGNAVQNWVFLRFLPLLIGDKISNKAHPVWRMVLTLIEFVTIVTSPVISCSVLPYMKALFKKYLYYRTTLFKNVPLRCKHHYVEHYDELTKMYGPLCRSSTLRFEAKHKFFRNEIRAKKNVKNPTLTASVAHQKMQSSLTIENLFELNPVIKNPIHFNYVEVHPSVRQLIIGKFGKECADKLLYADNMSVHNISYSRNKIVIVSTDNYPDMDCVKINVLFSDGNVGYAAGFECVATLNNDLMVHSVKETDSTRLVFLDELKDFIPYSLYSFGHENVIVLKHLYIRK